MAANQIAKIKKREEQSIDSRQQPWSRYDKPIELPQPLTRIGKSYNHNFKGTYKKLIKKQKEVHRNRSKGAKQGAKTRKMNQERFEYELSRGKKSEAKAPALAHDEDIILGEEYNRRLAQEDKDLEIGREYNEKKKISVAYDEFVDKRHRKISRMLNPEQPAYSGSQPWSRYDKPVEPPQELKRVGKAYNQEFTGKYKRQQEFEEANAGIKNRYNDPLGPAGKQYNQEFTGKYKKQQEEQKGNYNEWNNTEYVEVPRQPAAEENKKASLLDFFSKGKKRLVKDKKSSLVSGLGKVASKEESKTKEKKSGSGGIKFSSQAMDPELLKNIILILLALAVLSAIFSIF